MFFIVLGLFFGAGFTDIIHVFPLPVLGVILFFEGLMMMRFISDTIGVEGELAIALLVGVLAACLPYGFIIGIVTGTLVAHLSKKYRLGFSRKTVD
jgi:MFS superfamily sulfate permease-like transporter